MSKKKICGFYSAKKIDSFLGRFGPWSVLFFLFAILSPILFGETYEALNLYWSWYALLAIPIMMEVLYWGNKDSIDTFTNDSFLAEIAERKMIFLIASLMIFGPSLWLVNGLIFLTVWLIKDGHLITAVKYVGFSAVVCFGLYFGVRLLCYLGKLWLRLNGLKYDEKEYNRRRAKLK